MVHAAILALLLSSSDAIVPSVKAPDHLEPATGDATPPSPGKPPAPGGPAPGVSPNSTGVNSTGPIQRKNDPNDEGDWLAPPNVSQPPDVPIPETPCAEKDFRFKDLDVIVLGATGTIGELVAAYFAHKDPATFRFGIAGRNIRKLDVLRQKIFTHNDPEPIMMSLDNEFQMVQMIHRTRVLLNLQGPYEQTGAERVIKMALRTCTHYVDISTEFEWQVTMMKTYKKLAATRGIAVVHNAGATALPADFLALRAAEFYYKWTKKPPHSIKLVRKESRSFPTEGMKNTYKFIQDRYSTLKLAPYVLLPGLSGALKVDATPDGMDRSGYTGTLRWYKNAAMDCAVVRRSLYKTFERPMAVSEVEKRSLFSWNTPDLHGSEEAADQATKLSGEKALDNATTLWPEELPLVSGRALTRRSLSIPLLEKFRELIKERLGSPSNYATVGYFQAEAHAFGHPDEGREVRVYMSGMHDITLVGTATFAAELAHGLADGGPMKQQGGYLTPALALGTERLRDSLKDFVTINEEIVADPEHPRAPEARTPPPQSFWPNFPGKKPSEHAVDAKK